jgi:hypothetical protein
MKRNKTMKLTLIAALSIAPFGWANANCHNIAGQWVATYDEVLAGDSVAGVGNLIITANRIDYYGAESYLGVNILYFATGHYTVDQYCNIVWDFLVGGVPGVANGVVVNRNEIVMILSNATFGASARFLLKRLENFN